MCSYVTNDKTASIVKDILGMQIGLPKKNLYRFRGQLLKKLVCSSSREYEKVLHVQSRGASMFTLLHCGRFLLQKKNRVDCYSAFSKITENSVKLFSFSVKDQCKDLIIWSPDSPLSSETLVASKANHSTSLLYVTSNGYLMRRCALTGKTKDKVYLSPRLKFTEIQCDPESDRVVLKSTRHQRDNGFLTFAIFSSPPLQFIAAFEVNKSVFGKKAVDGGIQQGILFIRHSDNKVKLYSLDYILSKFTKCQCKLGDTLEGLGKVGDEPSGLPITVIVNREPPVLMEVVSAEGDFNLGGNPWRYITKPNRYESQVHTLGSGELVASINTPNGYLESEHVFFHPDDSNRLVHMSNSFVKISWMRDNDLCQWLHYKAPESEPVDSTSQMEPQQSRYGRTLRPSQYRSGYEEKQVVQDLSLVYDCDTDLIGVLRVREHSSGDSMILDKVMLFDNIIGDNVRTISLDKLCLDVPFDLSTSSIVFDGPNFLVITKHQDQSYWMLYSLMEKEK